VEHLVDDLLLLARLDEAAPGVEEQVDLDDLVLAEAARLGATTGLTVETGAISAARVVGSPIELGRVVRNLADNAARHARSTVMFTLRIEGDRVVLTVDDDGAGIDPDDRARVFDRFVRLDDARSRDGGGAGLGLAIVRAVAQAHGGTASIGESRLGGVSAEVGLPIAPAIP
jgi:signal transduction histidine kinase